ncbi:Uncharacterized protein TCM_015375 [Theobroma cacao]|uniref:Uncharacterized protein n=1 Tax=Theobroma cacao TaxID=3641 RepID=A0A061G0W7_THECC|nr:Uncharacterized protein TCM_015375 [Theobroma cacao]
MAANLFITTPPAHGCWYSGKALSAIPAQEHFKPFTGQYYTIVQSTLIVVLETENVN